MDNTLTKSDKSLLISLRLFSISNQGLKHFPHNGSNPKATVVIVFNCSSLMFAQIPVGKLIL